MNKKIEYKFNASIIITLLIMAITIGSSIVTSNESTTKNEVDNNIVEQSKEIIKQQPEKVSNLNKVKNLNVNGKKLSVILESFFTENPKWEQDGDKFIFTGISNFDDNRIPVKIEYKFDGTNITSGYWYLNDKLADIETTTFTMSIMCNNIGVDFNDDSYKILSGIGDNISDFERNEVAKLNGNSKVSDAMVDQTIDIEDTISNSEIYDNKYLFASMLRGVGSTISEDDVLKSFSYAVPKNVLGFSLNDLMKRSNARIGVLSNIGEKYYIQGETDHHIWVFECDFDTTDVYIIDCMNTDTGEKLSGQGAANMFGNAMS